MLSLATSEPPTLRCRLGLDLHVVRVNNYLTQSQGVTFCSSAAVLLWRSGSNRRLWGYGPQLLPLYIKFLIWLFLLEICIIINKWNKPFPTIKSIASTFLSRMVPPSSSFNVVYTIFSIISIRLSSFRVFPCFDIFVLIRNCFTRGKPEYICNFRKEMVILHSQVYLVSISLEFLKLMHSWLSCSCLPVIVLSCRSLPGRLRDSVPNNYYFSCCSICSSISVKSISTSLFVSNAIRTKWPTKVSSRCRRF